MVAVVVTVVIEETVVVVIYSSRSRQRVDQFGRFLIFVSLIIMHTRQSNRIAESGVKSSSASK